MIRYLFELSVNIGYKLLTLSVIFSVMSLIFAPINDIAYIVLCIFKCEDSFIGKLSLSISKSLWGAIAPFIAIAVISMICYLCKILIVLGVM